MTQTQNIMHNKSRKDKKEFIKTSVMHQDIGKHEHKMVIYESYENYAVCRLCGMHDWNGDGKGDFSVEAYKKKYPTGEVVSFLD
jgi:hypothetical protein